MVETNARILAPGKDIALPVRYARVQGATDAPELREKVCYRLRREHGLIAVPCQDKRGLLIVATDQPVPTRQMTVDDWDLNVSDVDESAVLTLATPEGWQLLPKLVERMMTDAIERCGEWWSFDSLRHWYEREPFDSQEGIDALRRYAVSALAVEGVGVAVAVDVQTAFFTQATVAGFFDATVPLGERQRRRTDFERLTQRQSGQHGTLLYNNGESASKCYFASLPAGKTCGTIAPRRVRGKNYASLVEYYQKVNPRLGIRGNDMAALVSFPGLDQAQPVAARCLKVRVMNDMLPASLINADKIGPQDRRLMVIAFWKRLGRVSFPQIQSLALAVPIETPTPAMAPTPSLLSSARTGTRITPSADPDATFLAGFWRPQEAQVRRIGFPKLRFGNGETLEPPLQVTGAAYKQHFKRRAEMLDTGRCYHFPPLLGRTVVCAYPEDRGLCEAAEEMAGTACQRMQWFTGKPFEFRLIPYASIEEAIAKLSQEGSAQVVLFVLNDEPAAYTEAALGLPDWKIKRVTEHTLRRQYRQLTAGSAPIRGVPDGGRGQRSWDSFIRMTSLDLLQEMDGVPFRLDQAGAFEAQLVIDVSYDRRYYAQSVLIARECAKRPDFRLVTDAWHKPDTKHEAINGRILCDDVVRFLSKVITADKDAPLASLLIARDGRVVGGEQASLDEAVAELRRRGVLTPDARVEVVELHKNTEMHLRVWEIERGGAVSNVTEATAVRLSHSSEILVTTGAGTLTQGTAEPLLIVAVNGGAVGDATDALAASAQLNWSSPGVAQRLPLPFKRTDEVLKKRSEQEIRRIH